MAQFMAYRTATGMVYPGFDEIDTAKAINTAITTYNEIHNKSTDAHDTEEV